MHNTLLSNNQSSMRQLSFEERILTSLNEIKKINDAHDKRLSNMEAKISNLNVAMKNLETPIQEQSSRPLPSDMVDNDIGNELDI